MTDSVIYSSQFTEVNDGAESKGHAPWVRQLFLRYTLEPGGDATDHVFGFRNTESSIATL